MNMRRLITVLLAAALIFIFGMIAALLSSCGASSSTSSAVIKPVQNGSSLHPWRLQDGSSATLWHMASGDDATPRSKWSVVTWTITNEIVVQHLHTASFVLYGTNEYQVISIDVARKFIYAYQQ